jgi:hypothetical protein
MNHCDNFESKIDLVDSEDKTNIYTYETIVLKAGSKCFELKLGEPSNYLLVVSAKLRLDMVDCFD